MSNDFGVAFPPNARLASLEFAARDIRVQLQDGGSVRTVPAADIAAIHGARIRREAVHPAPLERPSVIEMVLGKEGLAVNEELQCVIAIRTTRGGEVWYLVADTFNFRKALGAEAGLVLDQNLRTFLRKLATVAPQAVQDSFVTAMLAELPLPPPIDSLMEFFKAASR